MKIVSDSGIKTRRQRPIMTWTGLEREIAEMEAQVAACKAEHDAATASLAEHKARLRDCDKGIAACAQRKEGLTRRIAEHGIDRKKMEHE